MSLLAIAAAAAEEAAAHAEPAAAGLPQFDPSSWPSQLFWLAVFFGGLYWMMAGYFLPRIGATIEERRDRIADDFDQAAEFRREAEEAQRVYETSLADAKARARAMAAANRDALNEELAERQHEADARAAASIEAAERRIAAMKVGAAAKVRQAAAETARAIVETLIDETPTTDAVATAMAAGVRATGERP